MLSTLEKTRDVYKLYDRAGDVTSAVVDSGHDYNKEMRELFYRHAAQHLLGRPDEPISEPDDLPVEAESALQVGLPANTETMESLTFRRAGELAGQITEPSDAEHWISLKQDQQQRLRDDILGGILKSREGTKTLQRTLTHNGYAVEHWTFEPEPGILVPAVLCLPSNVSAGESKPAVLIVDETGKQTAFDQGLVDELVERGNVVLAIDYRGVGETHETVPAIGYGPAMPEYNLTNYSLFIGRPLAGARVVDIRYATDFLTSRSEVDAKRIAIVGRGRGALSALLAASLDERLGCVVTDELLASLVFDEEFVDVGLEYFIPRLLTVADIPHLLAHIGPRPLLMLNAVDGRRREVSDDVCGQRLKSTTAVYDILGAKEKLQIARSKLEQKVKGLADWLQGQTSGGTEAIPPAATSK
jgi:hypothetical protein